MLIKQVVKDVSREGRESRRIKQKIGGWNQHVSRSKKKKKKKKKSKGTSVRIKRQKSEFCLHTATVIRESLRPSLNVSKAQRREPFSLSGHFVHFRSRDADEIHLLALPSIPSIVYLPGIESHCVSQPLFGLSFVCQSVYITCRITGPWNETD